MANTTNSLLVTLTVTATDLPAGKTFANIAIIFTDAAGTAATDIVDGVTALTGTFDTTNSAPGAFTVVANAMATDGTVLATQSGAGTIVAAPPATFPAPASLTVTLS